MQARRVHGAQIRAHTTHVDADLSKCSARGPNGRAEMIYSGNRRVDWERDRGVSASR